MATSLMVYWLEFGTLILLMANFQHLKGSESRLLIKCDSRLPDYQQMLTVCNKVFRPALREAWVSRLSAEGSSKDDACS